MGAEQPPTEGLARDNRERVIGSKRDSFDLWVTCRSES